MNRPAAPHRSLLIYILLLVIAVPAFWALWPRHVESAPIGPRRFTRAQLALFDGEQGRPIYLAIKGRVHDVTAGRNHYGKGSGYHGFVGRDASRAFADLCFTEECLKVAHIVDGSLPKATLDAIDHWAKFYEDELTPTGAKKYPFVGVVVDE